MAGGRRGSGSDAVHQFLFIFKGFDWTDIFILKVLIGQIHVVLELVLHIQNHNRYVGWDYHGTPVTVTVCSGSTIFAIAIFSMCIVAFIKPSINKSTAVVYRGGVGHGEITVL